MIKLIQSKISLKIAILTNLFLFLVTVICVTAHFIQLSRQYDNQYKNKGKMAAVIGAKGIGRILEEAIDNGALTLEQVMDTDYQEIPGFDPPKYHTRYDRYTDRAFLTFQDEFMKTPDLLYAASLDRKGYAPTHNSRYSKPITGDPEKDLSGNRTKRIYQDPISVKAALNKEPGFVQKYHRDTGEVVWDISSPIFVKGVHWGAFRIGFEMNQMNQVKQKLLITLGTIVFVILFVSMTSVFFLINKNLQPLVEFTRVASDLADGKIEEKIESNSKDEIGRLADVLERLRMSLKAAMDRLSR